MSSPDTIFVTMTHGNLLRGTLAMLIAGGIATAAFLAIGIGLPNWIYGSATIKNSPEGSTAMSVFLSFASVYAVFAFILLTVFVYRRLPHQTPPPTPSTHEIAKSSSGCAPIPWGLPSKRDLSH